MSRKNVMIAPVVSEKSYNSANSENKYTFYIATDATKIDVKRAVEEEYGVSVKKVNVVTVPGKLKINWKIREANRMSDKKKAVVTLVDGDSIDDFLNI